MRPLAADGARLRAAVLLAPSLSRRLPSSIAFRPVSRVSARGRDGARRSRAAAGPPGSPRAPRPAPARPARRPPARRPRRAASRRTRSTTFASGTSNGSCTFVESCTAPLRSSRRRSRARPAGLRRARARARRSLRAASTSSCRQLEVEGDQRRPRRDQRRAGGRMQARRAEVGLHLTPLAGARRAARCLPRGRRRARAAPERVASSPYRKTGSSSSPASRFATASASSRAISRSSDRR